MRSLVRLVADRCVGVVSRFQAWRHMVRNPGDGDKSRQLDRDLGRLSLAGLPAERTKAALNEPEATIETFPWFSAIIGFIAVFLGSLLPLYLANAAASAATSLDLPAVSESLKRFSNGFEYLNSGDSKALNVEGVLGVATFLLAISLECRWYFMYVLPNPFSKTLLYGCVHAIDSCAKAYGASPSFVKRKRLRGVDKSFRVVERNLLSVHKDANSMLPRSPRGAATRRHGAVVAGVLREKIVKVDTEGDRALCDLAELLLHIAERYASGQVGALLPEDYPLEGVTPASTSRSVVLESLHVVVTLTAGLGAAVAMSAALPSLHVPQDLHPWVLLITGVSAAIAVSGWRGVTRILEAFPGK